MVSGHRVGELLRPNIRRADIEALHDELIGAGRSARAKPQILHRLHEGFDAGDIGQLQPQIREHLVDIGALALVLQLHEELALVERIVSAAYRPRYMRDIG